MNLFRSRVGGVFAATLLIFPAAAQTITNLQVKAATSKHVDLSWTGTASSYTVQRRVLGGTYGPVATVTNSTFSDTSIDPYTTYDYQVTSGAASSNSVTVGPPPSGLSNAAPAPLRGSTPAADYGYNIALTLDGNGDPAFLFGWADPNGDTDDSDGQLLFRSWNRAQYAWNAPVKVATLGDAFTTFRSMSSLAYDASTATFGAAAADGAGDVIVWSSTDGVTWTKKKTFANVSGSAFYTGPSLALNAGNLHLSLIEDDTEALHYVTGKLSADSSTWTDKTAPKVSGVTLTNDVSTSLAVDSAGNPGIAYWTTQNNSYNAELLYWKPASGAAPVKIMDSQNNGDDNPNVKLAFFNLNPRVLAYIPRNDADPSDALHFARSDDGGLTWQTPVVIPPDGNSSTDYPFDLSLDSQGNAAAAFGQNSGSGDAVCGNPKLSRSTDLVHWSTCAIAPVSVTGAFGPYPGSIQLAFGGNDKLYLLWWEQGDTQANTGVLMYREPPPTAVTGPSISDVVDGASFRPNIVAGSWVTIRGTNLSDTTRT